MSIDRREDVLSRLLEILEGIAVTDDTIENTFRNHTPIENDKCPAFLLLDGSETVRNAGDGRGRVRMGTVLTVLHPQIFVLIRSKKPKNVGIGTTLNAYRGTIVRAIAADEQLVALVGPNGSIVYDGAETDLNNGMAMQGEMQINLSITVPLNPNA